MAFTGFGIGGWAGIAAKLAGAGTGAGAPGFGAPGVAGGQLVMPGFSWGGIVPKAGAVPTSPYYPTTAPEYKQFAPDEPGLGGYFESLDLGYGYKPGDMPGQMDVFMLADPNNVLGQISAAELWSGRGTQTTPWGQEAGLPAPPEPILGGDIEKLGLGWAKDVALLPQEGSLELKTYLGAGGVFPSEISGTTPSGEGVFYSPSATPGQMEVRTAGGELLGIVPGAYISDQLGAKYGALGTAFAEKHGAGGGYARGIPSEEEGRKPEDLLTIPGAVSPEMASRMLAHPLAGTEKMAAAFPPPKEVYSHWLGDILTGEPSAGEVVESFAQLFRLEGEAATDEATRLLQDVVQFGLLQDVGEERARQLYNMEYKAQLAEGVEEEEAAKLAATARDDYLQSAEFLESFMPTGFSWDAFYDVLTRSGELQQEFGSLFREQELPYGIVRKFPSISDYYRWQTETGEAQPTTEAEAIWTPYRKVRQYIPRGEYYMAEPGGEKVLAETAGIRDVYVSQDVAYEGRAEKILGYIPRAGEVIAPSDARAILRSAMWAGGAEAARYAEVLKAQKEAPSDYRKIYEEFVEELDLYRPSEIWQEGR